MTTYRTWDELRELAAEAIKVRDQCDIEDWCSKERIKELAARAAVVRPVVHIGQERLEAFSLHPGWSWPTARPTRSRSSPPSSGWTRRTSMLQNWPVA